MLKQFFDFILGRKEHKAPESTAPYKIEAPVAQVPAKCGCGRSQSGFCVGLHKLTPEEWANHADNPNKPAAKKPAVKAKSARTKKAPVAAMTAPEKTKKAPAKKPRVKKADK